MTSPLEPVRRAAMNAPGVSEIGQIAVIVSDVAASTTFYRDVLGLKFLFSAGPNLAFLAAGSVRLMLTTPQGHGEAGKNSILYFKVSDLGAVHSAIIARGAKNEREPALTARMPDHELWIGFVRDPDDNLVGLMSEVRQ
jgi:predicted enzyme related to lactoylglutathione lyase